MSRQEPIALYCLCGFAAEGVIGADNKTYEKLRAILMRGHDGPGHGPATHAQAHAARKRSEGESCRE